MEKPKPKKEVAIDWSRESDRMIGFYATKDALSDIKEFGTINDFSSAMPDYYHLRVDRRYDFNEVLKYIENYG